MPLRHLRLGESSAPASVRERELEVGRLVLRAAASGDAFLVRRAGAAVRALDSGPARRALRRAAEGLVDDDAKALQNGLLGYGAVLERHAVYDVALEVYTFLMAQQPTDALATLHAARAARRLGRREQALELYREAGRRSGGDARMLRLVAIGESLLADDPATALGTVIRDARRSRDGDALAIAREERSRFLANSGRGGRAARDLVAAAGRYTDRIDRVRVIHRLAELLSARGDLAGAREALLAALDIVPAAQRGHTVQRLRTVARAMGDELELRRTRGQGAATLVSLAPLGSRRSAAARSLAPALRRWRDVAGGGVPRAEGRGGQTASC